MPLTHAGPATAPAQPELDWMKATCRRQAQVIDALRAAVSHISDGARALKAENAELRVEAARLREARAESAPLLDEPIPAGPHAAAAARGLVVRSLHGRLPPSVVENAKLLVSELVTNSVRHSGVAKGEHVVVRVHRAGDTCRLEVEDPGCEGAIAPASPDPINGSGMGLYLVQTLSRRWGVIRAAGGPTRVWAQLASVEEAA
jgi:anti-sigma regulatory factor (Ser/Thr protein kinase)